MTQSFPKPIFVTSLKEANIDDACGARFWYHKFHRGEGITPTRDLLPNEMFEATLSDMRTIALMEDISKEAIQEVIDEVLLQLKEDDHRNIRARELLYRRLGWMAAYALFIEPQIRKIYKTIDIAEEATIERESLMVRVPTSGRLLQHRSNHQIEHREFVLTGAANAKWREGWEWNMRPHLSICAIREGLGVKVDFARIVGLATGFAASIEGAQLHHPYVYGHFNQTTGEWTHAFKMKDEDGGTWRERPLWEYPGTLTDWVVKVGVNVAEQQFPLSPKIPLNGRMVTNWLSRRLYRERHIQSMKTTSQDNLSLRNLHFPQRTDQCTPLHAAPCPFKDLCWSEPFMAAALLTQKFTLNSSLKEGTPVIPLLPLDDNRMIPPQATPTISERVEQAIIAGRAEVVGGFVPIALNTVPY